MGKFNKKYIQIKSKVCESYLIKGIVVFSCKNSPPARFVTIRRRINYGPDMLVLCEVFVQFAVTNGDGC